MSDLGQLSERHRFTEREIGSSIVISDTLGSQPCHAVSPEERKRESHKHQEKKQRVHESDVSVGIPQAEPSVEIAHSKDLGPPSVAEEKAEEPFLGFPRRNRVASPAHGFEIKFVDKN